MRCLLISSLLALAFAVAASRPGLAQSEPANPDREAIEADRDSRSGAGDAKTGRGNPSKEDESEEEAPRGLFAPYLHGKGGISFEYLYTGEVFNNMRGGMSTHRATAYRGNLDMVMKADLEKVGFAPGGNFFLYGETGHGYGITRYVGDYQVISNIDAPDFAQVSECWYDRKFFDGFLTLRAGKQDCNAEFAVVDLGGDFIHSSFGCAPTIPMPRFPACSAAVAAFFQLTEHLNFRTGVWDGAPAIGNWGFSGTGDTFSIMELKSKYDVTWAGKKLPGDFHVGAWYHNGPWSAMSQPASETAFELATVNSWRMKRIANTPADPGGAGILTQNQNLLGNYGVYLGFDQLIFKERGRDEKDSQGLGVFGQLGWNPQDRNYVEWYLGGGLVYKGLLPSRDDDTLGLGVARAQFSGALTGYRPETVVELFYKAKLTKWASLQPDLQYLAAPGGDQRDAFVGGLRYEVAF